MIWLGTDLDLSGGTALVLAFVITAAAGALMVSRFAYHSFKEISGHGRISFTYAFVIPLIFILIALNPPVVLFSLSGVYALSGPVVWLWKRRRANVDVPGRPGAS